LPFKSKSAIFMTDMNISLVNDTEPEKYVLNYYTKYKISGLQQPSHARCRAYGLQIPTHYHTKQVTLSAVCD
jgi:hypothetical protein